MYQLIIAVMSIALFAALSVATVSYLPAWRTTARNATLLLLYRCGMCPHRLHRWYYRGFATE